MRKLTYKKPGDYIGWDITIYDDYVHIIMKTPIRMPQTVFIPMKIFERMLKRKEEHDE